MELNTFEEDNKSNISVQSQYEVTHTVFPLARFPVDFSVLPINAGTYNIPANNNSVANRIIHWSLISHDSLQLHELDLFQHTDSNNSSAPHLLFNFPNESIISVEFSQQSTSLYLFLFTYEGSVYIYEFNNSNLSGLQPHRTERHFNFHVINAKVINPSTIAYINQANEVALFNLQDDSSAKLIDNLTSSQTNVSKSLLSSIFSSSSGTSSSSSQHPQYRVLDLTFLSVPLSLVVLLCSDARLRIARYINNKFQVTQAEPIVSLVVVAASVSSITSPVNLLTGRFHPIHLSTNLRSVTASSVLISYSALVNTQEQHLTLPNKSAIVSGDYIQYLTLSLPGSVSAQDLHANTPITLSIASNCLLNSPLALPSSRFIDFSFLTAVENYLWFTKRAKSGKADKSKLLFTKLQSNSWRSVQQLAETGAVVTVTAFPSQPSAPAFIQPQGVSLLRLYDRAQSSLINFSSRSELLSQFLHLFRNNSAIFTSIQQFFAEFHGEEIIKEKNCVGPSAVDYADYFSANFELFGRHFTTELSKLLEKIGTTSPEKWLEAEIRQIYGPERSEIYRNSENLVQSVLPNASYTHCLRGLISNRLEFTQFLLILLNFLSNQRMLVSAALFSLLARVNFFYSVHLLLNSVDSSLLSALVQLELEEQERANRNLQAERVAESLISRLFDGNQPERVLSLVQNLANRTGLCVAAAASGRLALTALNPHTAASFVAFLHQIKQFSLLNFSDFTVNYVYNEILALNYLVTSDFQRSLALFKLSTAILLHNSGQNWPFHFNLFNRIQICVEKLLEFTNFFHSAAESGGNQLNLAELINFLQFLRTQINNSLRKSSSSAASDAVALLSYISSNLFKLFLENSAFSAAYAELSCYFAGEIARSSALRRLVLELTQRRAAEHLNKINFSVADQHEIEEILAWQARTTDLTLEQGSLAAPLYYSLVISHCLARQNYLSAAKYEIHAYNRIQREIKGKIAASGERKALLSVVECAAARLSSAIECLKLAGEQAQLEFILHNDELAQQNGQKEESKEEVNKICAQNSFNFSENKGNLSKQARSSAVNNFSSNSLKLLRLSDLENEFQLNLAESDIIRAGITDFCFESSLITQNTLNFFVGDVVDCISLLVSINSFDRALSVLNIFMGSTLAPDAAQIFSALAEKALAASNAHGTALLQEKTEIKLLNLSWAEHFSPEKESAQFRNDYWRLIRFYLEKCDIPAENVKNRLVVAEVVLRAGIVSLPSWLTPVDDIGRLNSSIDSIGLPSFMGLFLLYNRFDLINELLKLFLHHPDAAHQANKCHTGNVNKYLEEISHRYKELRSNNSIQSHPHLSRALTEKEKEFTQLSSQLTTLLS
jgi:hypothetical protein